MRDVRARVVVLAALVVAAVSFFPVELAADETPGPASAEPLPTLAVYGDSFTSGYAGMGVGEANWTTQVARRLNLAVANMAVGGTGWVQCPAGTTFPSAVAANPVPSADVVLIVGGFNDRVIDSSAAVGAAVRVTLRLIALSMPGAAVIVTGPQWPGPDAPPLMLSHRDAVRAAAAAAGVTFLDPIADGWFIDPARWIWPPDRIHPTNAGHQHLADLLTPAVARALGR